jgi:hypothetical protein
MTLNCTAFTEEVSIIAHRAEIISRSFAKVFIFQDTLMTGPCILLANDTYFVVGTIITTDTGC